ncbi:hypothetical protein [Changpingibacter yushuensis]|uniref:hypothetical protein n=1 Tax=Changpingibacter yushuensis TaxID=2758440 RepID=UPI0015F58F5E|nr:hypothetical protein [Changpingibacter yushuensis]
MAVKSPLLRTRVDDIIWFLTARWAKWAGSVVGLALIGVCVWMWAVPWVQDRLEPTVVVQQEIIEGSANPDTVKKLASAQVDLSTSVTQATTVHDDLAELITSTQNATADNQTRLDGADARDALEEAITLAQQVDSIDPTDYESARANVVAATSTATEAMDTITASHEKWQADQKTSTPAPAAPSATTAAPKPAATTKAPAVTTQAPAPSVAAPTPAPAVTSTGLKLTVSCDRSSAIKVVGNGSLTVNGSGVSSGATVSGTQFSLATTGTSLSWSWVSGGNCA